MGLTSGAGRASAEPSLPRHYRPPPVPAPPPPLPPDPPTGGRGRRSALGTAAAPGAAPAAARAHAGPGARAPPAGGGGLECACGGGDGRGPSLPLCRRAPRGSGRGPRAPATFGAARSFMGPGSRRAPPAGTRSCPRSAARRPPHARPAGPGCRPSGSPAEPPPPPPSPRRHPGQPRSRPRVRGPVPSPPPLPLRAPRRLFPPPAALSQLLAAARTHPLPPYAPVTRAGPAAAGGPRAGWEATSRALPPRWKELVGSLRRTFFCLQSLSTTFTAPAPYPSAPSAAALTLVAPRRSRPGGRGPTGTPGSRPGTRLAPGRSTETPQQLGRSGSPRAAPGNAHPTGTDPSPPLSNSAKPTANLDMQHCRQRTCPKTHYRAHPEFTYPKIRLNTFNKSIQSLTAQNKTAYKLHKCLSIH